MRKIAMLVLLLACGVAGFAQTDCTTPVSSLCALPGAVSTLQLQMAALPPAFDPAAILAQVTSLKSTITALQAQIATLQDRVDNPPIVGVITLSNAISGATATCSGTSCTVAWTTLPALNSCVVYGDTLTLPNLQSQKSTEPAGTNHSVTIAGLTAGRTYYFWPRGTDASGATVTWPPIIGSL